MKSEVREIPNSFKEINDYRSIKPEGDITVKESRKFWDKQFGCEISKDNHIEKSEYDASFNQAKDQIEEETYDSNYEDYEFYDEWLNRDMELEHMSLEEYNELRCMEDYGLTAEDLDSGDEDW